MKTVRQQIDELLDTALLNITKANHYSIDVTKVDDSWREFADVNIPQDSAIAFHYFGLETIQQPSDYEDNEVVESRLDLIIGIHFTVASSQSHAKVGENVLADLSKFVGYTDDSNIADDKRLNLMQIKGIQSYGISQVSPIFYDSVKQRAEVFILISINYLYN